jgi:coenzyme F420 hydrogenase subunit beta
MFGSPFDAAGIGHVREIAIARAIDPEIVAAAQYGGVVTALSIMALGEGVLDSVVLTGSGDKCAPGATSASTRREVLDCAGSSYMASPTVEAFNRAAREAGVSRIGVVGTPCQLLALAHMKMSAQAEMHHMDKLALTIGLFCTWALEQERFVAYLRERLSTDDIVKVDIPPPPADTFEIYKASGRVSLPLREVRSFVREACTYCLDMTAEFADISVGAAEGIEGWNTVIVRTKKGARLFEEARRKGMVEVRTLPAENTAHLKEAALLKKKRGLKNILTRTGRTGDFLYLRKCPEAIARLLEGE